VEKERTMKPDEIIKAAWNGKRPPGMKMYEHTLYYEMRLTFAMYLHEDISKEEGNKMKVDALERYERGKLQHEALVEEYGAMD